MQTSWAAQLDPLLSEPLLQGRMILNVFLTSTGITTINHGLGRLQQGWILIDVDQPAEVFRAQPFNDQTLILNTSANVTVSLYVF